MTEKRSTSHAPSSSSIMILPLGATEQHGPHLPFETDTIIAQGVVDHVKALLPAYLDVTFLPVEAITYSPEHLHVAGTRSLQFDDAINRWIEIGLDCAAKGCKRLVFLNAHGGNSPLMVIAATELRLRASMLAVTTSWTRFPAPEGLISPHEKAYGIHGGQIETSVMLALRPDLVDMAKAEDFTSSQERFAADYKHLRAYGPHAFGWKMSDLSEPGVVGNAAIASAELGTILLDNAAKGFIELLEDVAAFDLTSLS